MKIRNKVTIIIGSIIILILAYIILVQFNIDSDTANELKGNSNEIYQEDIKGKGIVITITDNINSTNQGSDYLIHNTDLIALLSEIEHAGAQAISINDQRIINTTSIICTNDGKDILVDNNKITSPFVIKAIGSQDDILEKIQEPEGSLEVLYRYGLVQSIEKQNNITIKMQ